MCIIKYIKCIGINAAYSLAMASAYVIFYAFLQENFYGFSVGTVYLCDFVLCCKWFKTQKEIG